MHERHNRCKKVDLYDCNRGRTQSEITENYNYRRQKSKQARIAKENALVMKHWRR